VTAEPLSDLSPIEMLKLATEKLQAGWVPSDHPGGLAELMWIVGAWLNREYALCVVERLRLIELGADEVSASTVAIDSVSTTMALGAAEVITREHD
jgi:hypothetical protein